MDYIQEELLRQRNALADLLLGRRKFAAGVAEDGAAPGASAWDMGSAEHGAAEEAAFASATLRGSITPEEFAAAAPEDSRGVRRKAGVSARRKMAAGFPAWAEAAFQRVQAAGREAAEDIFPGAAEAASRRRGQSGAEMTAAEYSRRRGGADLPLGNAVPSGPAGIGWPAAEAGALSAEQFAGDAVQERTVTELWQAESGSIPAAEALSRVFQRDARRYDGGFPLY